jgi:hypothetical protein
LSNERIARLLAAEIERVEAWHELNQSLELTRRAFRADHAGLSEDEVATMLSDIINEVRKEDSAVRHKLDSEG